MRYSERMTSVRDLILNTLATAVPAGKMQTLKRYLDDNGYFECQSSSHNAWRGGTAEHVWSVYLMMRKLRDERYADDPVKMALASDKSIIITALLHDICDMRVSVTVDGERCHGHGKKSKAIMEKMGVGNAVERDVVCKHMHSKARPERGVDYVAYDALHSLICDADHRASAAAWNAKRFKERRTQHKGTHADMSYLRRLAMDRSTQILSNRMYVDDDMELRTIRGYNRDNIIWNEDVDVDRLLESRIVLPSGKDILSAAHDVVSGKRIKPTLVIGVKTDAPKDDNRLRRDSKDEQALLVCSNLLNTFYSRQDDCDENGVRKRGFKFKFTMRDLIAQHYNGMAPGKGLRLPDVTFFRDGEGEGFKMVKPWCVDVLLVPGMKEPAFLVK